MSDRPDPRDPRRGACSLEGAVVVVAFLAGAGSSYLTALTIVADGGLIQSGPGL